MKGIQAEHSKIESEFQLAILDLEKKVCLTWRYEEQEDGLICSSSASTHLYTNDDRLSSLVKPSLRTRTSRPARLPTLTTRMRRMTKRKREPSRPKSRMRMPTSLVFPSSGSLL